jgi:hypothetical protein
MFVGGKRPSVSGKNLCFRRHAPLGWVKNSHFVFALKFFADNPFTPEQNQIMPARKRNLLRQTISLWAETLSL